MTDGERLARHLTQAESQGHPCSVDELRQQGLDGIDLAGAYASQAAYGSLAGKAVQAWKVGKSPQGVPVAAPIFDLRGAGDNFAYGSGASRVQAIEVEICYPLTARPPVGSGATSQSVGAVLGRPHLGIELIGFRLLERNAVPFPLFVADRLGNHSFLLGPELPADIVSAMPEAIAGLSVKISANGQVIWSAPAAHPAGDPVAPLLDYLGHGSEAGPMSAGQIVTTGSLCGVVAIDGPGAIEVELGPGRVAFRLS